MNDKKVPRSVGIHSGVFHADEVTACVLLALYGLIDADKIIRTRDLVLLAECEYVCDVGGVYDPKIKKFDHHQVEYQGPKSSAGMILEYLKDENLMSEEEYHYLNKALIRGVDDFDNGRNPPDLPFCVFSLIIANFNPIEYGVSGSVRNRAFDEAFDFIYGHIDRMRKRFHFIQTYREIVRVCMKKYTDCLIFDENIPWMDNFFALDGDHHSAKFIIMPSGPHWKLRGIPPNSANRTSVRISHPKEWAGLLEGELKEVSGIPGAVFCHKGCFISVWETKEDAITAFDSIMGKS